MKVLTLDLTKPENHLSILDKIRESNLQSGDKIKLEGPFHEALKIILVVIIVYFIFKPEKNQNHFADEVLERLFDPNLTAEQLEKQIKDEFGIEIEPTPQKMTGIAKLLQDTILINHQINQGKPLKQLEERGIKFVKPI